jgi:hypothetical protein
LKVLAPRRTSKRIAMKILSLACAALLLLVACDEPSIHHDNDSGGDGDADSDGDGGQGGDGDDEPQCHSSADCGGNPCSPAGRCVQCLTHRDCEALTSGIVPFCSPEGMCVTCLPDLCDGVCNPVQGCVDCNDRSDCPADFDCEAGFCRVDAISCEGSEECPDGSVCDDNAGQCYECVEDRDCGTKRPHCLADGRCAQCKDDTDCTAPKTCGILNNRCQ